MKYWLFDPTAKRPVGPFAIEQLPGIAGFGPETLAAPENAVGPNPWKHAREFSDLAPLFPAAPSSPPAESPAQKIEPAAPRLAGFWARVGAALIDILLLGFAGQLLGFFFYEQLCRLGAWGRPLGFLIAAAYLVPLTSVLGGGRTLGKRALKLQVVDRSGRPLSIGRAFLRESILILPSFLNYALVPAPFNTSAVETAMGAMVFIVGPSLIYLFVFNRRTRQGLHDLLAGSYVVEEGGGEGLERLPSVWAGHYAVLGIFVCLLALGGYYAWRAVSNMPDMAGISAASRDLQASGRWIVRSLTKNVTAFRSFKTGVTTRGSSVTVTAVSLLPPREGETDTDEMARILFKAYPDALKTDNVVVYETYGFDIGIASRSSGKGAKYSPEKWMARLSSGTIASAMAASPP